MQSTTKSKLDTSALDQLFRQARSQRQWFDKPVSDELLREVYELAVMAPTSANCLPARIVFVKSPEAKERLKPHLMEGNIEQTMTAPVTAIIGQDLRFFEKLPQLYPAADAKSWFAGNDALIEETAFRNSSLQGAYLMLAARACGLDCGPMSGFDTTGVDAEFFPNTSVKSNFLCNLGYGDESILDARFPRLGFDEACLIC